MLALSQRFAELPQEDQSVWRSGAVHRVRAMEALGDAAIASRYGEVQGWAPALLSSNAYPALPVGVQ